MRTVAISSLFLLYRAENKRISTIKRTKNRRHPTEVECRLFCPILSRSCRFRNFLKLLSYRHTPKYLLFMLSLQANLFRKIIPQLFRKVYHLKRLFSISNYKNVGKMWCDSYPSQSLPPLLLFHLDSILHRYTQSPVARVLAFCPDVFLWILQQQFLRLDADVLTLVRSAQSKPFLNCQGNRAVICNNLYDAIC